MQTDKGLALGDIVTNLVAVVKSLGVPQKVRIFLLDKLADLEYRLAFGTDETLQVGSLISCFVEARHMLTATEA